MARKRQINHMADEQLMCRTLLHAWENIGTPSRIRTNRPCIALRCVRCATERIDYVTIYGELLGRYYDYPEGYSYDRNEGEEMPNRQEFRRQWMKHNNIKGQ